MKIHQNVHILDWNKMKGIMPVIIQHYISGIVLMHGYMTLEAFLQTKKTKIVTFFSRSKQRLWVKGEVSKNYLNVIKITTDCDGDVILVLVKPSGFTCHLKRISCFLDNESLYSTLYNLEKIIESRKFSINSKSYIKNLYHLGINRITQKVGEEAVETIISVFDKNINHFIDEVSDLIFHLLILLHYKNLELYIIIKNLKKRIYSL
ncbi:bifunctional phosphoribosyl-AMP cyclohydrolase/phosphoribosyl-ATP diphosphatase HisIE [Buchnera aphidicola]|uniref:Histidine biosynthesis bifunctional protein HisIE n=1 Tax=Buchnera aphidicola subsp. Tuberolachnus salignus TaxID=98804 RepID=A0A160SVS0_BUCTT|nr:bifunctional phosphoribosyl-AMP cyclohydrolase/phosphoribosyl-ATP diphosphatase HisIE [Buchnera aphidicola]CUR53057.1 Histidine biosynthesis bifunctional protein HisIE [Buchnera aphidicola (Tuberolachnus salignus)]